MRMFSLSVQKAYLMVGGVPMEVPLHMDLKDKWTALCNLEDPFIENTCQNPQPHAFKIWISPQGENITLSMFAGLKYKHVEHSCHAALRARTAGRRDLMQMIKWPTGVVFEG